MSPRIGIIAGVVLLMGIAVWVAIPNAANVSKAGRGVAPVIPAPETQRAVATPPSSAVPPVAPGNGDVHALVENCRSAQVQVAARRAARGGPTPPGEPTDAGLVAQACAPLYHEPGCRKAQLDFDKNAPALRMTTLLQACEHDYCPLLPAPKPSICDPANAAPADGMETFTAWADLRAAILRHDIGEAEAARAFPR
ncbi:MAG TPA: hypothetical protein VIA18_17450 [Polyangia bacterium]|nr:hypothetical protein [Polyangia bacterium]